MASRVGSQARAGCYLLPARGISSAGRAPPLQGGGRRFDPVILHRFTAPESPLAGHEHGRRIPRVTLLRPWALAALLALAPMGAGMADAAQVGNGTPGGCTSAAVVVGGRAGRRRDLRLRARAGDDPDAPDREGAQHQPVARPRRRRPGDAERRRQAADPLPEHLRPGAGLDDRPLPGPGDAAAGRAGTSPSPTATPPGRPGRRRRRRDLRPRRAADDHRLAVHRQPLRPDRSRPRRRRGPGAQPVPRPAGARRRQHVHRGAVLPTAARSAASACRGRSPAAPSRGNRATGRGANPARPGTPGGGNGGAIYLDGNRFTLTLRSSMMEDNIAPEGGGAIFFVSNDRTGTATLAASTLRRNPSLGFETAGLPGHLLPRSAPPGADAGHPAHPLRGSPSSEDARVAERVAARLRPDAEAVRAAPTGMRASSGRCAWRSRRHSAL